MKVLTVRQPAAWEIIHGGKVVENRSWPTLYRGPLLIHAGQSRADLDDPLGVVRKPSLVFGAIIGVVRIVDCLEMGSSPPSGSLEAAYIRRAMRSRWACGPVCWVLADPRPLTTPIPCKGRLSLWEYDVRDVAELADLLP